MHEQLTARLLKVTALTDLIGVRFNWGRRVKTEALPALTAMQVSPGRFILHSGADGTGKPRIQFNSYGRTAAEAKAVKDALLTALETRATEGGLEFTFSILDGERGPMIEDTGGGKTVARYEQDFFVWFSPAA